MQLFGPLEDVINRSIRASGDAADLCRKLSGCRLVIDPVGLPGALAIEAEGARLRFSLTGDKAADCTIQGLPITLARAGMSGSAGDLRTGAATISGDPGIAQDFQRLLDLARPDWEEEISRILGDPIAHKVGNLAREMAEWGRRTAGTLAKDSGEFLTEESRQIPTRFEMDEFLDEVDRLREDVDRLAARLGRIEQNRSRR